MKGFLALVLAAAVCLVPITAEAARPPVQKLPLVIVFAASAGDDSAPSDSEVVAAVVEQLRNTGRAEVFAFSPDLPTVARAVMERRLSQELLKQPSDPQKAVQIAAALGAQYALRVQGSVVGAKVSVNLELLKASGGGRWTASSESEISQVAGANEALVRNNAVYTAASSAVSQIVILGLGQAAVPESAKPPTEPLPALPSVPSAPKETAAPRDTAAEYAQLIRQADSYVAARDLPNAIMELRRAINLEPADVALRVRLAGMYSDLGMTAEAIDECKRALLFDRDDAGVHKMLVRLYTANGALAEAAEHCREMARLDPRNVEIRMTLGDLYWNQAKIDDAVAAFDEAGKLAPGNPVPHERLHKLFAARKMYVPALEHLLQARLLGAGAEADSSARYAVVAQVIQDEFNAVTGKLDTARRDVDGGRITREDYYQECTDATSRVDALTGFLSTQTAPGAYRDVHPHGVLAVNLLAQAAGYLISYLETERQHYAEQALLLQAEARTEMSLFAKAVRRT